VEIFRSIVVEYLERSSEQEDIAVAYIYCSYKEQGIQTNVNLIASLVQQLAQTKPTISDEIKSFYHDYTNSKKKKKPTVREWTDLLQLEARLFSRVFIIIDALDECSDINSFLTEIRKLQLSIHLFVTSRYVLTIEHEFEMAARVEIRASDEDVRRYVGERIMRDRLAKLIKPDPTLRETIVDSIAQNSKGM
jgi:hypothetical protein